MQRIHKQYSEFYFTKGICTVNIFLNPNFSSFFVFNFETIYRTVVNILTIRTLAGCFFICNCIVCLLLLWRCVFVLDVWANGRLQATVYFPSLNIFNI